MTAAGRCLWCGQTILKSGPWWTRDGDPFCMGGRVHRPDPRSVTRDDPQPGRTA